MSDGAWGIGGPGFTPPPVIIEVEMPARTRPERALFAWIIVLGAIALLGLYAQDDLKAWLRSLPVQTSGPVPCRQPTDFEQLHIVLAWRDEKLVVTGCLYLGSKGTYRPGRPGKDAPL